MFTWPVFRADGNTASVSESMAGFKGLEALKGCGETVRGTKLVNMTPHAGDVRATHQTVFLFFSA